MRVTMRPVNTGTVLERFDVLEDGIIVGYIQRERRPPANPRGVWVPYTVTAVPIEEGHPRQRGPIRAVLGGMSVS